MLSETQIHVLILSINYYPHLIALAAYMFTLTERLINSIRGKTYQTRNQSATFPSSSAFNTPYTQRNGSTVRLEWQGRNMPATLCGRAQAA